LNIVDEAGALPTYDLVKTDDSSEPRIQRSSSPVRVMLSTLLALN
jgi:hypothetical protein